MLPSDLTMQPPRSEANATKYISGNSSRGMLLIFSSIILISSCLLVYNSGLLNAVFFFQDYPLAILYAGSLPSAILLIAGLSMRYTYNKTLNVFIKGIAIPVKVELEAPSDQPNPSGIFYKIFYNDKDGNEYMARVGGADKDKLMSDGQETTLLYLPEKPHICCLYDPNKGLLFGIAFSQKFLNSITGFLLKNLKQEQVSAPPEINSQHKTVD
jgi:hypothetical protein